MPLCRRAGARARRSGGTVQGRTGDPVAGLPELPELRQPRITARIVGLSALAEGTIRLWGGGAIIGAISNYEANRSSGRGTAGTLVANGCGGCWIVTLRRSSSSIPTTSTCTSRPCCSCRSGWPSPASLVRPRHRQLRPGVPSGRLPWIASIWARTEVRLADGAQVGYDVLVIAEPGQRSSLRKPGAHRARLDGEVFHLLHRWTARLPWRRPWRGSPAGGWSSP